MPLYLVNKNLIPYSGEKSIQTVSPQKMNKNYHAFKNDPTPACALPVPTHKRFPQPTTSPGTENVTNSSCYIK